MALAAWCLTEGGLRPVVELGALLESGAPCWIDLEIGDLPALEPYRGALLGHPLSWEDAGKPGQRPKLEDHGDHLFLIVRSLDTRKEWLGQQLQTLQLACFLGARQLITVRSGALRALEEVHGHLERGLAPPSAGPDGILHAILDGIVDAYAPHMDRWEEEVERLDKEALRDPRAPVLGRILAIRKHMVKLRRLAAGQAEILGELSRGREGLIHPAARPYFKDVHDHLVSVLEAADSLRDSVSIAVDIYLNSVNNRLNQIMKVLTVMSALMLPLTLVTGVFGMNFVVIPGLHHPQGFWWTMGGMAAMAMLLLAIFRRYRLI